MLPSKTVISIVEAFEKKCSYRDISAMFGVGHGSAARIKKIAAKQKLTANLLAEMSDQEIKDTFYPSVQRRNSEKVLPDFEVIYSRIKSETIRTTLLDEWHSYYNQGDPSERYAYTQFKVHYYDWKHQHHPEDEVVMTVFRQPGRYLYIDWVGDKPLLVRDPKDPTKKVKVHILVTTLGYSSLTWFEAYPAETKEYVALGITRALEFYGAVPYALRPDNMATVVTANKPTELTFTKMIEDLAKHYDMEIHPCRPFRPKDKAAVERAVLVIEQDFLAKLGDECFETYDEFNKKAAQFCQKLNSRRKAGETKSRLELYNEYDLPCMHSLPQTTFILYEYTTKRVPRNYHVYFDNHYYSVPYTFCQEHVTLKTSIYEVVICDKSNREIARHKRSWKESGTNWKYITLPEHMPSNHLAADDTSEARELYFQTKARTTGPWMEKLVSGILRRTEFEQQNYRSCSAILAVAKKLSRNQAEEIARECVVKGIFSYRAFNGMAEKIQENISDTQQLPEHKNIRGEEEYQ